MNIQNVTFTNKNLNLRLAGHLYLPADFNDNKTYAAVVVTGPMLSVKEQAQVTYARYLADAGYVALTFDGAFFGESEGFPRQQELPNVKESDIEGAVDFLENLPYVDKSRIGGLGICGSGSYMSVAGVKEPRLKAITAIVPAISNIATSPMTNFFMPEEEVRTAKAAYENGTGELFHLNFLPRAFEEGAAYYYTARGNKPRWSNRVVAWSQLELINYNVTEIMKDMIKPYLVITSENAWSQPASREVFDAAQSDVKEWVVIPEAGHYDLYDLFPFVDEAVASLVPFFNTHL